MNLCLLSRYFNMNNAGIGRMSVKISEGMKSRGHKITTVSDIGKTPMSYLKYSYWNIIDKIPPEQDLYHAITAMEARYLPPVKSICTIADMIPVSHPERAGSGLNNNFINRYVGVSAYWSAYKAASKCERIAVISSLAYADVVKYLGYPERRIKTIRLGINQDLKPANKPNDYCFRIGYLGQLDRRKRVDVLIKAFKESNINGELIIAGDGVDAKKLHALADDDNRIGFTGFMDDRNLSVFYNSLDVFVFPTWIEGYGLPIVEALACKRPVVVLNDAIIPDEVKNRCVISDNLTKTLEECYRKLPVVNNEDYQWAKSHDWDNCISEYEKLYKEVIG